MAKNSLWDKLFEELYYAFDGTRQIQSFLGKERWRSNLGGRGGSTPTPLQLLPLPITQDKDALSPVYFRIAMLKTE